jgi:uncharacterized protein YjbI with pentapeptide repeats
MSKIGSYKNTAFRESQKFLVLDPSTSSTSLVLGSDLVAYITPQIGSVKAESTRLSAENTDYKVGEIIQTSGATVVGSLASVYLVVAGGAGDFPMLNGNDLLVIAGDDALREQLISQEAGQGASLVSMQGGPTVEVAVDNINKVLVTPEQFGAIGNGIADDTAAIQSAIDSIDSGFILGNKTAIYRLTDRLSIVDKNGVYLDFRGATILDTITTLAPDFGNRPNHFLHIVRSSNIYAGNIIYDGSQRTETAVFVGIELGLTAANEPTFTNSNDHANYNICIENVTALGTSANMAFVAIQGNSYNVTIKNFALYGDYSYGINIEYGLKPLEDYSTLGAKYAAIESLYGVHPYNIKVEGFNGFDNLNCIAHLRTSGAYNIIFENCYVYNVSGFIVNFSSDTSIDRIGQSVEYKNCSNYFSTGTVTTEYAVSVSAIEIDPQTNLPVPAFTKWEFKTSFTNCEFDGGGYIAFRFIGNTGKTVIDNCMFKNSTFALRIGGSVNRWEIFDKAVISVSDCIFKNNEYDIQTADYSNIAVKNTTFKEQINDRYPINIIDGNGITFDNCIFHSRIDDKPYVLIGATCTNTFFSNCYFDNASSTGAVLSQSESIYGYNNVFQGIPAASNPFIDGDSKLKTFNIVGSVSGSVAAPGTWTRNGDVVYFSIALVYLENGTLSGNLSVTGLPYQASAISYVEFVNAGRIRFTDADSTAFHGVIESGGSTVLLKESLDSNLGAKNMTNSNFTAAANNTFGIKGWYFV